MALNIKNDEVDKLVTEVARLTGESKTQAVLESLRQRLEREKSQRYQAELASDLLKIGEKCASYGEQTVDHAELLFDDDGLPN